MEKYRRLKEAFGMIKEKRPEATMTIVRKAILKEPKPLIKSRKTSDRGRAWYYVRPCDILSYYEKLEKDS